MRLSLPLLAILLVPLGYADTVAAPRPADYALEGDARVIPAPDGNGRAIRLEAGAKATIELKLAAPREVDGIDPSGWMLYFDVDVLDVHDGADLVMSWSGSSGRTSVWGHPDEPLVRVRGTERKRRGGLLDSLDAEALAGGTVQLQLEAVGGPVTFAHLSLARFHRAPKRKLLGKANGRLGPDQIGCGMLGFTAITEHEHTAFTVLDVREGGPADRAGLRVGDVVMEIDGERLPPSSIAPGTLWFERSHEAVLGRTIEARLAEGERTVVLGVERAHEILLGKAPPPRWIADDHTVTIELPIEGPIDAGFPLRGAHGERLHADLVHWTTTHQKKNGTWPGTNAVNPALGALALLGTNDDAHAGRIERAKAFLMVKNPRPSEMRGLAYWTIAFQGMLLSELYLANGDESVLPWIREAIEWLPTTTHTCKWGMPAFGHGPDGIPYGDKALMAPAAHLLVFDALARKCGVESTVWEHIEPYVRHSWSNPDDGGHGAMGYNAASRDRAQFWSRTGLVALAETLRGDDAGMAQTLCIFMEERHPWMLNSHAYGEPGAALGLLSLAVVKPKALEEILPQWRWRFLCAWEPGYGLRYSTPHMGAPYLGEEAVVNLAYLLLFATVNDGLAMATVPR